MPIKFKLYFVPILQNILEFSLLLYIKLSLLLHFAYYLLAAVLCFFSISLFTVEVGTFSPCKAIAISLPLLFAIACKNEKEQQLYGEQYKTEAMN